MPNSSDKSFTKSHIVLDDGAVAFKCSDDKEKWPWLALRPSNPLLIQAINYFVSVETSRARGVYDSTKWSALTQTTWQCAATGPDARHATHGLATPAEDDGSPSFGLALFDDHGDLVCRMTGVGVVFQTRDFEAWRKKARDKILALPEPKGFCYASPEQLGVATEVECLVSPLIDDSGPPAADALITKANGFQPGHPYHDGSGDHVNSSHLVDVAGQVAKLIRPGSMICGGEVAFLHYVELDRPLRITQTDEGKPANAITFALHQADRLCSTITLKFLV